MLIMNALLVAFLDILKLWYAKNTNGGLNKSVTIL